LEINWVVSEPVSFPSNPTLSGSPAQIFFLLRPVATQNSWADRTALASALRASTENPGSAADAAILIGNIVII
jgi:hypothetical protein